MGDFFMELSSRSKLLFQIFCREKNGMDFFLEAMSSNLSRQTEHHSLGRLYRIAACMLKTFSAVHFPRVCHFFWKMEMLKVHCAAVSIFPKVALTLICSDKEILLNFLIYVEVVTLAWLHAPLTRPRVSQLYEFYLFMADR